MSGFLQGFVRFTMLNMGSELSKGDFPMQIPKIPIPRIFITSMALSSMLLVAGCRQSRPPDASPVLPDNATLPPIEELVERESRAETTGEIKELIRIYELHAAGNRSVADAETRAASLYLLLGADHAQSNFQQRSYYKMARSSTVEAMMQNESFRKAVNAGQPVETAAEYLGPDLYEPLFLWATSIFYHFRDVASIPEKIINRSQLKSAADAIGVLIEKDPEWFDGCLQFSLGIYYLSVPEFAGGDRQRAASLINDAVDMGNRRLLTRWGRAKYLAVATGDQRQFEEDLTWVIDQDISEMQGPVIWNRYFIEDSRELLATIDGFF